MILTEQNLLIEGYLMASTSIRRNGLALVILMAKATLSSVTPYPPRLLSSDDYDGNTRQPSPEFWYYIAISSFLVLGGGVFAGYGDSYKRSFVAQRF